jgi:hypothetical protein
LRGVPIEDHCVAIGGAIFSGRAPILGDKPSKYLAENRVGVFHADLLVRLFKRHRNEVEEGVNECRIHVDDIIATFLGHGVRRLDGSAGVCVDGTSVVRHIVGFVGEGLIGVGIRLAAGVVCIKCVIDGNI